MPISAMPEHLNSKEEIEAAFPDDSQYGDSWFGRLYKRYQKATKTQFAFSYRCTERWAKWRKFPKVLLAIGGKAAWRFEAHAETELGITSAELYTPHKTIINRDFGNYYLSRIQYYKRWHLSIQWPLMITFHFYFRAKDVPVYGVERPDTDGKLLFAYWGHFDSDLVYWMITSIFVGTGWK